MTASHDAPALDYDAIIIGAGISGLYQLYRLRELGMRVRVFEAGTGVGGTWYWNRYPGARFDSESYSYSYSFSQELLEEWNWSEHFAPQPETLRYLNHVADKFDLRRDIQFRSRVAAAHWQEATRRWDVTLEDGSRLSARFLITAIGPLSAPTMPRIEGVETFQGQSCHTARWPHEPVSFEGKRVAVIGTGATGVQTIQEVAKTVGHLTVFQRTPNWCAPLHNSKIDAETMAKIKAGYPEMFKRCQETFACFLHTPDPRGTFEVTPEEREAFWEKLYADRGFGIWQGNFRDILTDREANDADLRFRGAEDPPAGEGPGGRREADPEEPRLRHPPRAAGDPVLRGLQPAQRRAGGHQRNADRADHADGHQDQRRRVRVRHHHLRDRFRCDHRQLRPHRHPGRGRAAAEGQMGGRAADLSRRPGRGLSQHDDADGAAYRARQHSAQHRIQRRLGDRACCVTRATMA